MLSYYPLLVPLAPLTAALLILLFERSRGRRAYQVGALVQAAALAVSVRILQKVSASGAEAISLPLFPFQQSGAFDLGFYFDRLAAVMVTLISGISLLIFLFSIRYMEQERGRVRYHTLLLLTTFSLICMVTSKNLLMLFIFWQLLSWLLYLLLAFNYSHPPTIQVALKTFFALRVGDVAFLSGIGLAYATYGTLDFQALFAKAAEGASTYVLGPWAGSPIGAPTAITLLIFIGAMSKSAQFPLHGWLPDSMYTPTPVSALMHAGIVNSGGFLLNRLAPFYGLSSVTLHVIFVVGAMTTFLGASMTLTQNDIKKTLGYSTIGQMGYMIMECGLGAFALAIFHLIAHGLFKATLFLYSGSGIHAARLEPRFPPKPAAAETSDFSRLAWFTGFVTTLILPLTILLATHGILKIPLSNSQGAAILLFFAWVTSSQAILSLYRLQAVSSWRVAGAMILTLVLVIFTYLTAVEAFTYFLYPSPGQVTFYFEVASLPVWLFDLMVGSTALFIILGWIFIYAKAHGKSILMPEWMNPIQPRLYLLFINRLYLDALGLRLGRGLAGLMFRFDRTRLATYGAALIALGVAGPGLFRAQDLSAQDVTLFLAFALMLPLFPLHGVYVAGLTRLPGVLPVCFAIVLPIAGLYGLSNLLPKMPPEFLDALRVLAVFGALYGSLKALAQVRVRYLVAYAGFALFSILWWHLGISGTLTPHASGYGGAVALVTAGLLLAWHLVRNRYGDLDLNRIGGLARPMPRFAILMALLVMAAAGLPPFGLFSGFFAMLLHPSVTISWDLIVILLSWLAASWYLFRFMQRLLFGPIRSAILYDDFRLSEAAPLLIVLFILLALGIVPYRFFSSETLSGTYLTALELIRWNR